MIYSFHLLEAETSQKGLKMYFVYISHLALRWEEDEE
jgi:hypothetical protein